ncbi:MAG: imidazoleglycerol-phosphate dehydratase HisB [Actinomycetota bacterium]|nr:imidazoleglycerol-phosphate dehydratase HisB [Actinomycetota bacterium]
MARSAIAERNTAETRIAARLELDGSGTWSVDTGIPFFDHMLAQLAKHGGLALEVKAEGDIEVDSHHLVEDVGIVLGGLLREALGAKEGLARYSSVAIPLDEALVSVALDLSGRPYLYYQVDTASMAPLGNPAMDPQLAEEFFRAFVNSAGICLHIELVRGKNAHHVLEAAFKAVARAIRAAKVVEGTGVPSTKGVL